MVQSSGKEHGYKESLPYMDTICIHEGRVCLQGKYGKSKLVRSCVCVCSRVCARVHTHVHLRMCVCVCVCVGRVQGSTNEHTY